MNLQQLKKHIAMNGGATLTSKGEHIQAERGYMVSLAGSETITTLEALTASDIKKYLRLAKSKGACLGLWLEAGKLYIDLSRNVATLARAIAMGKQEKQLAIYDLQQRNTIYLTK